MSIPQIYEVNSTVSEIFIDFFQIIFELLSFIDFFFIIVKNFIKFFIYYQIVELLKMFK